MEDHSPVTLSIEDRIAFVRLDDPSSSVNKLSRDTLEAFDSVFSRLQEEAQLVGAVFLSGKESSFVVGADIEMLRTLESAEDAEKLSRSAHAMLSRIRNLPFPTVAAIHGAAMGGGLELALACTYRVATDARPTRLALPEVRLGLCPGAGGTQYLPRQIGLERSLSLMLTGKNVYPGRARRIGLVDAVCSPPLLRRTAVDLLRRAPDPSGARLSFRSRVLESTGPGRALILREAAKRAQRESRGHYPAPVAIIECVRAGYEQGIEAGLETEAATFGRLLRSDEARALIGLFLARGRTESRKPSSDAVPVQRLGILGAGLMGSGIASVSAAAGLDVVVKDRSLEIASNAVRETRRQMERKAKRGIVSPFERDAAVARVFPADSYAALEPCDLVIEAVPEDVALKREVLRAAEAAIAPTSVLATNTSAIPLAKLVGALERPQQLVGMHYFSPVEKMPLLEVVQHADSSSVAVATARDAGVRQGKTVIVVNDGPGFYTTRILAFYLNEAFLLFGEGAGIEAVDRAMVVFGFPMGPFELLDLVGIDTAASINRVLASLFERRGMQVSGAADKLASAGLMGQKSGSGFYAYARGRNRSGSKRGDSRETEVRGILGYPQSRTVNPDAIVERLVLAMVAEAIRVREEEILESAGDGDVGAVFGLGFPPYTGGPFRYVDQQSPQAVALRLGRLARSHGPRFEPPALLQRHAAAGTSFHEAD